MPEILPLSANVKLSLPLPPVMFSISENITVSVGEPVFCSTLPPSPLFISQLLAWSLAVKVSTVVVLPIKV